MNPCLSRGLVSPVTESGIKLFWKPRGKLKVKLGKKTMDFSWLRVLAVAGPQSF